MKTKVLFLLLMLASVAVAQNGKTFDTSGYAYYRECKPKSAKPTSVSGECGAFTAGVLEGLLTANSVMGGITKVPFFEIPADVTIGQLILVVLRYMDTHPANRNNVRSLIGQ